MKNTRGVVIGLERSSVARSSSWCRSSSSSSSRHGPDARRTSCSSPGLSPSPCSTTSRRPLAARDYLMIIAFINSFILTVVSVAALVISERDGRLRLAASREPAQPVRQHLGAGRLDRAARRRAHDLGAAEGWVCSRPCPV